MGNSTRNKNIQDTDKGIIQQIDRKSEPLISEGPAGKTVPEEAGNSGMEHIDLLSQTPDGLAPKICLIYFSIAQEMYKNLLLRRSAGEKGSLTGKVKKRKVQGGEQPAACRLREKYMADINPGEFRLLKNYLIRRVIFSNIKAEHG